MKRGSAEPKLAEALRQRGPLAALDPVAAAKLVALGTLVELAPGEMLIREGDAPSAEVFLLVEGALVVQSGSGTLARLSRPGDVVGEVAVLLSAKRTASVVADGAVKVLAIPTPVLKMPEFSAVAAGISSAMLRDDWIQY